MVPHGYIIHIPQLVQARPQQPAQVQVVVPRARVQAQVHLQVQAPALQSNGYTFFKSRR